MAKFTWIIETAAGSVSQDSPTLSEANIARALDYFWALYAEQGDARTPANEAKAFRAWVQAQFRGLKADVIKRERVEAAKAAKDAIQDIEG